MLHTVTLQLSIVQPVATQKERAAEIITATRAASRVATTQHCTTIQWDLHRPDEALYVLNKVYTFIVDAGIKFEFISLEPAREL